MRSFDVEDFDTTMQSLYENVKNQLQESTQKYKHKKYLRRRQVQFEVRDLVVEHMRK